MLFSLHPNSLSKWKSQLIILTCPAVSRRTPAGGRAVTVRSPLGDFPCLSCRQIIPGSPSDLRAIIGGSSHGGPAEIGRFLAIFSQEKSDGGPQVTARCSAASRRSPADGEITPGIGRSSGKF